MANSTTQILTDAYTELRDEANEAAESTGRSIVKVARELPYALLGAAQANSRRSRQALKQVLAWPGSLVDRARRSPEELRETFWQRAEDGRSLLDRVRNRTDVRDARKKGRNARAAVKRATTATGKAARAAANAATDAAQAFDPADTRPYEDRTREELYALASDREIEGRSQMNKKQLIKALRNHRS